MPIAAVIREGDVRNQTISLPEFLARLLFYPDSSPPDNPMEAEVLGQRLPSNILFEAMAMANKREKARPRG